MMVGNASSTIEFGVRALFCAKAAFLPTIAFVSSVKSLSGKRNHYCYECRFDLADSESYTAIVHGCQPSPCGGVQAPEKPAVPVLPDGKVGRPASAGRGPQLEVRGRMANWRLTAIKPTQLTDIKRQNQRKLAMWVYIKLKQNKAQPLTNLLHRETYENMGRRQGKMVLKYLCSIVRYSFLGMFLSNYINWVYIYINSKHIINMLVAFSWLGWRVTLSLVTWY